MPITLTLPGIAVVLTGLILSLGRWILETACLDAAKWHALDERPLTISVNISGRHLQHADLVADVRSALESSGLEPENLVIELTESTIMHNTEVNLERFRETAIEPV